MTKVSMSIPRAKAKPSCRNRTKSPEIGLPNVAAMMTPQDEITGPVRTSALRVARAVHEWHPKPSKSRKGSCGPDNHWFDCLVGCAGGGQHARHQARR